MKSYLYSPHDLALIIQCRNIDIVDTTEFLSKVYQYDNAFIEHKYRHNQKSFMLDVMDMMNYVNQAENFCEEKMVIEKDLIDFGIVNKTLDNNNPNFDEINIFFKDIRLNILYLQKKGYIKMKLRTLLSNFGYKKRSQAIINYIQDCLLFYHIEISLRGNEPCDLNDIKLDDMIIFRIV